MKYLLLKKAAFDSGLFIFVSSSYKNFSGRILIQIRLTDSEKVEYNMNTILSLSNDL